MNELKKLFDTNQYLINTIFYIMLHVVSPRQDIKATETQVIAENERKWKHVIEENRQ